MTGMRGRFEIVSKQPLVIYDVAHNKEGVLQSLTELKKHSYENLHIIYGCVNDKDVASVLKLFPEDATFYFTQAQVPRAMDNEILTKHAEALGIVGNSYKSPPEALTQAKQETTDKDCILVIGSFFILEDLL